MDGPGQPSTGPVQGRLRFLFSEPRAAGRRNAESIPWRARISGSVMRVKDPVGFHLQPLNISICRSGQGLDFLHEPAGVLDVLPGFFMIRVEDQGHLPFGDG